MYIYLFIHVLILACCLYAVCAMLLFCCVDIRLFMHYDHVNLYILGIIKLTKVCILTLIAHNFGNFGYTTSTSSLFLLP